MRSLCVFCGSSFGEDPAYQEAARSLGRTLAEREMRLVYGGGRVGLMGAIADAALEAGGEVVGVIPETLLEREIGHKGLSRLHVVGSMHERKALMSKLAGGFVALPGGCGTLEELFEVFTWAQLGMHDKPCGLLNVRGYYDPLLRAFDRMVSEGFLSEERRRTLTVASTPEDLLVAFDQHTPPTVPRWIDLSET